MTRIIGLTGSAGIGKSTLAEMAQKAYGIMHWNADKAVHELMQTNQALIMKIQQRFPKACYERGIDRKLLRSIVFQDPQALAELEALVHPYILEACQAFIKGAQSAPACILEIPLLFEVGWEKFCDVVILVTASPIVQRDRLKQRGLSIAEIEGILARQWNEEKKRPLVDYVVDTGMSQQQTWEQLQKIIEELDLA